MLAFDDARTRLLADVALLFPERVPIAQACGRVLARDIVAPADLPLFDYSAMDGYAVNARDFDGAGPWDLEVIGLSRTGRVTDPLRHGSACRIFTGAQVPDAADAVVMQEDVERVGDRVRILKAPKRGQHIRYRGEDLREGTVALRAGERLRPGHLGLAASVDASHVWVSRCPVVTIVSTGDELRYPGEAARPASLPESVSVALSAMAQSAMAIVRATPFAPDDPQATTTLIGHALRASDLVITVGGISVGDHDVVRPALESLGVELDFWRVKIKPGKPIAVGRGHGGRVLGLPGNPSSAQVTFGLFGMPLLRAMQGDRSSVPLRLRARLTQAIDRNPGRLEFQRGIVRGGEDGLWVEPLKNQASGATTSMAMADCLLVIAEDAQHLDVGTLVEIIRLQDM